MKINSKKFNKQDNTKTADNIKNPFCDAFDTILSDVELIDLLSFGIPVFSKDKNKNENVYCIDPKFIDPAKSINYTTKHIAEVDFPSTESLVCTNTKVAFTSEYPPIFTDPKSIPTENTISSCGGYIQPVFGFSNGCISKSSCEADPTNEDTKQEYYDDNFEGGVSSDLADLESKIADLENKVKQLQAENDINQKVISELSESNHGLAIENSDLRNTIVKQLRGIICDKS